MKEAIEKNNTDDKRARAKRADLDAMQAIIDARDERFDAIRKVMGGWVEAGGDLPLSQATVVYNIAAGKSLDEIITDAGRAALGLE